MFKRYIEVLELPPSINLDETRQGLREYFGGLAWLNRGGGISDADQYKDDSDVGAYLSDQYILGMDVCRRKIIIPKEIWSK